jgi:hypothetical protein
MAPANGDFGLEHLVAAFLHFAQRRGKVGRVELRIARDRANVRMAEKELRQP